MTIEQIGFFQSVGVPGDQVGQVQEDAQVLGCDAGCVPLTPLGLRKERFGDLKWT